MSHAEYCGQFIKPGSKVLDVGSGMGNFLRKMADLGFDAHGVELNPERIFEKVVKASAESLPFPDNYFDFVNCAEVTEHIEFPRRACGEIFRVLNPGNKCYISFHNRFGVYDYHYRLYFINWMPRSWTEPILNFLGRTKNDGSAGRQKLATMHYYTYGRVFKFLRAAGFSVSDIREKKIKKKFWNFALPLLILYRILLRPLYFNTFHLLLAKP